jgi:enoyl-CoA hydratase
MDVGKARASVATAAGLEGYSACVADLVSYTLDDKVAVLQMDDGKANALSRSMLDALGHALDRAEQDASAIVLAGRAERFCAGFDLRVMMSGPDAAKDLLRAGAGLFMRLYGSPLPLVIACTGHALAGGALVVLTGDYRIGAAGAYRIGLNEVSLGMPVPVLAMELARDRLHPSELTRATLLAQIYDPDTAVAAGYLDKVVPAEQVVEAARAEAVRLAALARSAFKASKQRLRRAQIEHITSSLDADMRDLMMPTAS